MKFGYNIFQRGKTIVIPEQPNPAPFPASPDYLPRAGSVMIGGTSKPQIHGLNASQKETILLPQDILRTRTTVLEQPISRPYPRIPRGSTKNGH